MASPKIKKTTSQEIRTCTLSSPWTTTHTDNARIKIQVAIRATIITTTDIHSFMKPQWDIAITKQQSELFSPFLT
jgi:phosphoribulokinase